MNDRSRLKPIEKFVANPNEWLVDVKRSHAYLVKANTEKCVHSKLQICKNQLKLNRSSF